MRLATTFCAALALAGFIGAAQAAEPVYVPLSLPPHGSLTFLDTASVEHDGNTARATLLWLSEFGRRDADSSLPWPAGLQRIEMSCELRTYRRLSAADVLSWDGKMSPNSSSATVASFALSYWPEGRVLAAVCDGRSLPTAPSFASVRDALAFSRDEFARNPPAPPVLATDPHRFPEFEPAQLAQFADVSLFFDLSHRFRTGARSAVFVLLVLKGAPDADRPTVEIAEETFDCSTQTLVDGRRWFWSATATSYGSDQPPQLARVASKTGVEAAELEAACSNFRPVKVYPEIAGAVAAVDASSPR